MSTQYVLPRDRDAYATIRGYVYQVDLSLMRWLDLREGEHLELERGEDIDYVGRALGSGDLAEELRLLEQVKHREENLTLRNPAALEALANAVEHLQTNPGIDLRFCYSTNAAIGQEQPSLFATRRPAITVWEQIRRSELTELQRADALSALRRFLTTAAQPDSFDDEVWNRFQTYVAEANDGQLSAFIRHFEWSTGQHSACALSPRLRATLQERGFARDEADAEQLYERLFLYVFKLLSQPGIKRLTPEAFQEQRARPTLSESDHQLLARVRDRLRRLEQRVNAVEVLVASLDSSVRSLARRQGVIGQLTTSNPVPELGLPPPAPRLTAC